MAMFFLSRSLGMLALLPLSAYLGMILDPALNSRRPARALPGVVVFSELSVLVTSSLLIQIL